MGGVGKCGGKAAVRYHTLTDHLEMVFTYNPGKNLGDLQVRDWWCGGVVGGGSGAVLVRVRVQLAGEGGEWHGVMQGPGRSVGFP